MARLECNAEAGEAEMRRMLVDGIHQRDETTEEPVQQLLGPTPLAAPLDHILSTVVKG